MMAVAFRLESDVRKWLRNQAGERCFWVEPGVGGTVGLTDVVVVLKNSEVVFLELKLGWLIEKGGVLRFQLRSAQKVQLKRLGALGVRTGVMVGVKGGGEVVIVGPGLEGLEGRVELRSGEGGPWTVAEGLEGPLEGLERAVREGGLEGDWRGGKMG